MAEFSRLVITGKGQALLAKMIEGSGSVEFTRISSSSEEYTDDQLEGLESLSNIKQTSLISKEVAIKVEAAFTNTELTSGYYIKTLGLYASDPDDGEILYAVTRETSGGCYMPAYNGATVSGAYVQLVTTVGNSENVSLEVDPAAVATIGDIKRLQEQITELGMGVDDKVITEIKDTVDANKKDIEQLQAQDETIAEMMQQVQGTANEAVNAFANMHKNMWLVNGSSESQALHVDVDFAGVPVSNETLAHVPDANTVGTYMKDLADRVKILEDAGSGNNTNLKKITLTINETITVGTSGLSLYNESLVSSGPSTQRFTYIVDSEQESITIAIPVKFSVSSNQKFIGLIYGWISAKSSNKGGLRFFSRTGESSSTFTGFDNMIAGGSFSSFVETL